VVGNLSAGGGGGGGGGLLVDVDGVGEEIVALFIASERMFDAEDVSFVFVVVRGVGFTFIDDKIADRGLLDPS
jgi:hypothetical protein